MIELLIFAICLASFAVRGADRWPLLLFNVFTVTFLMLPAGTGLWSFVVAGLIDASIILSIYLMPKITTIAKHLATISALSILINIAGAAGVATDAAYILLYLVALGLIATGTDNGLRKIGRYRVTGSRWAYNN